MLTHKIYDLDLRSETTQFAPGPDRGGGPLRRSSPSTALRTQWAAGTGRPPAPTTRGDRPAVPGPVPAALRGGLGAAARRPHRRGHDRPPAEGRMIGLQHYLVVSAALFSLGVLGLLTRRNAVNVLMSIELILNSANINLVAFSRYGAGQPAAGRSSRVFVIVVAAAEVAVAPRHRAHPLPPAAHAEPRRGGHPEGLANDHGRARSEASPCFRPEIALTAGLLLVVLVDSIGAAWRNAAMRARSPWPRWPSALGFAFDLQASAASRRRSSRACSSSTRSAPPSRSSWSRPALLTVLAFTLPQLARAPRPRPGRALRARARAHALAACCSPRPTTS